MRCSSIEIWYIWTYGYCKPNIYMNDCLFITNTFSVANKSGNILQNTISNAFPLIKIYIFQIKFH